MNGTKWFLICAVFGWGIIATRAVAQEREAGFGTAAEADPFGKPPAAEKSVLSEGAKLTIKAGGASSDFCQCVGESESATVTKIEHALRGPLRASGLAYTQQPLSDVVSALQEEYGIPIQLDVAALDQIGTRPDQPVDINLNNVSLRSAMRLMLKKLNLTYVIQDEVLMITTDDEALKRLRICVYDVRSIAGERDARLDDVIDTVESCVATDTWSTNGGGVAKIRPIKPGLLVISQTAAVHEEIRDLLSAIRKAHAEGAAAPKETARKAEGPGGDVVTRAYVLTLNPAKDIGATRSQVRELITGSLPDEVWKGRLDDGQAVMVSVFHDRVVVRQTPAIQDKVQKILADSGIAVLAPADGANLGTNRTFGGGEGGGGGGFFSPEMVGRGSVPGAPAGTGAGRNATGFGRGTGAEGTAPGLSRGQEALDENPFSN